VLNEASHDQQFQSASRTTSATYPELVDETRTAVALVDASAQVSYSVVKTEIQKNEWSDALHFGAPSHPSLRIAY
jgi:hypothetical protein